MKKNIVVISGGDSSEYEISISSGKYIYSVLDKEKYNVYFMTLKARDWNIIIDRESYPVDKNDFSFNLDGHKISLDYAYITIHGRPGENGMLQGYLDMMNIPYSTCSTLCEALTFDKYTCTNYLHAFGINTTKPILIRKGHVFDKAAIIEQLGMPCFVKPNAEGSSFGVSKVKDYSELDNALNIAFEKCNEIFAESFIDGTEFTCGLYKTADKTVIFPTAEVISKTEFFDYTAKYDPAMSDEIIPGRFSEEITDKIKSMASKIYDILRCEGIVRIDGFVRGEEVIMLEVNTTPGMTSNSFVPKMVRAMNLNMMDVLSEIIDSKLS